MDFAIPHSMKVEHEELHAELVKITQVPGAIGEAGKAVADALHAHFEKEEEYALPPLGLLSALGRGDVTPDMADVLRMTDKLKAELPQMLEEHQAIVAALKHLILVAEEQAGLPPAPGPQLDMWLPAHAAEGAVKPEAVRFAEKLMLHAQNEEEVAYPAAILIGEYLKLKLTP